jgi:hypothetical protein
MFSEQTLTKYYFLSPAFEMFFLDVGPQAPGFHWKPFTGEVRDGGSNPRRPGSAHASLAIGPPCPPTFEVFDTVLCVCVNPCPGISAVY